MNVSAIASTIRLASSQVGALSESAKVTAEKVRSMTKDFESILMGELLKQSRQTVGPGGMFENDGADIYGGLFDFFMGKHLAESGGMGLAAFLESQIQVDATKQ